MDGLIRVVEQITSLLMGTLSFSPIIRNIFTKNIDTGALTRVDQSKNGNNGNDQSQGANATLSSDGNIVAFISNSTNLLDNNDVSGGGLYTKNLTTGDVELISRKLYEISYEGAVWASERN